MTTHERMSRMYEHREADRVPVTDCPWGSTIERWQREGMPADIDFRDYFGLDRLETIGVDNSPRYPTRVIEETNDYVIHTTNWGATLRSWKHVGGVPEFLDFTIKDPDSWVEARARMTPDRDRINWDRLKTHYPKWRENGAWVGAASGGEHIAQGHRDRAQQRCGHERRHRQGSADAAGAHRGASLPVATAA